MNMIVLGAGMMGRAIVYDLCRFSKFDMISIADKNMQTLHSAEKFLTGNTVDFLQLDIEKQDDIKKGHFARCPF